MHTFGLFFLVYLCTQTCFYITLLVIFINIVYLHDLARCLFTNDSMHFLVASFVSVRMRNICFVYFSRSCRHVFNSKRIFFFFNCLLFILPTVFTHFAYDFLSLVWVLNFYLLSVWLLQCFIWLSFSSRREWNEWKPKCARHAMQNEVLAIYWALWDIVQQQGQLQAFIHFWNCFFKRNKQKLMRNNQGKKRHFLKAQLQSKLKLDASSSYLLETLTSHFSTAYTLFEAERSPTEDNKKQYRTNFSHEN